MAKASATEPFPIRLRNHRREVLLARTRNSSAISLVELEPLHCDRAGGTSDRAQPASDALFLVVEECRERTLARSRFAQLVDAGELVDRRKAQAVLGANIDASVAEYALGTVVDGMDVAVEASPGLLACLGGREPRLDFCDTAAARQ